MTITIHLSTIPSPYTTLFRSGIIQLCWFTATCPGVAFTWDRSTQWFEAFYGASEDAGTGHRAEERVDLRDRKRTRLNSSDVEISYAVFCLKKIKDYNMIKLAS